ncbi:MAG: hypothetical protein N2Z21_10945 [Candidatus Sumerlaeaceae bacterium]|nr:hypothetical protein [Candidatus Sumerlaeaceae bacterium]
MRKDRGRKSVGTLRHWLEYAGWLAMAMVLRWLPRRALVLLADALGWLLYRVARVRRSVVEENLRRAFGTTKSRRELDRIALRAYQNAVLTFCEFVRPDYVGQTAVALYSDVIGLDHALPFIKKPAVFLTAHMGNWELQGAAISAMGFQVDAVLKPLHNPFIDGWVARRRQQAGFGLIPTTGSLKRIVSSVRRGRHPVFLADQDARRSGLFVDFLGSPASTAAGPAFFALKLGVPIVAGFSVRNWDRLRTLRLLVFPPLHADPDAPFEEEVERLTKAHVQLLEQVVREHPESYFWLHRRWKTRPKAKAGSL